MLRTTWFSPMGFGGVNNHSKFGGPFGEQIRNYYSESTFRVCLVPNFEECPIVISKATLSFFPQCLQVPSNFPPNRCYLQEFWKVPTVGSSANEKYWTASAVLVDHQTWVCAEIMFRRMNVSLQLFQHVFQSA